MRETIVIRTKMHMWWTWSCIAARHYGAAKRARSSHVEPMSYESPESASLAAEFESAIVAIAAVAFAMESLCKELEMSGYQRQPRNKNDNRGDDVARSVVAVFHLESALASQLKTRLHELFSLRNASVHFKSEWQEGTQPHPRGTNTSAEIATSTLEASEAAVRLGREVLVQCLRAVEAGTVEPAASSVSGELPNVIKMLDEVMAREGLKG